VRVRVGVPQLVRDAVQEQVPALGVHVDSQVLEDVHVAAVGNAGHAGAVPLGPDELDRLGADVHHQCVDHRDVVAHATVLGIQPRCSILQVGAKL